MDDMTILDELKQVILKELRKNADKGTLNPAEIDAVQKAVKTVKDIAETKKACKELEMMDKDETPYSGAFYNIRNFPPNSYGMMPNMSYGNNSYGWNEDMMGRFTSRESNDRSMRNSFANSGANQSRDNRSGHSINDRIIDTLERMVDSAPSEFERQQILDKISMIRNSSDGR